MRTRASSSSVNQTPAGSAARAGKAMAKQTMRAAPNRIVRLLHIFHLFRPPAEDTAGKLRLHELVEPAIEHTIGARRGDAGAEILHQLVGLQNVRADLVTPANVGLRRLIGYRLLLALLQFRFVELRA